jgi:hypothetical protein
MAVVRSSITDDFLADLTEAAYRTAVMYGVEGPSVDVELNLWKALGTVVRKASSPSRTRLQSGYEIALEDLLAELTAAAYQVSLQQGIEGPFIDLELELWKALAKVVWQAKYARPMAKLLRTGMRRRAVGPWPQEARVAALGVPLLALR